MINLKWLKIFQYPQSEVGFLTFLVAKEWEFINLYNSYPAHRYQVWCAFSRRLTEYKELSETPWPCFAAGQPKSSEDNIRWPAASRRSSEPVHLTRKNRNISVHQARCRNPGHPRYHRYGQPLANGHIQARLQLSEVRRAAKPTSAGIITWPAWIVRFCRQLPA